MNAVVPARKAAVPARVGRMCVVAAGGTGGHLFPAQALAEILIARGWRIALATDERGVDFAANFPGGEKIALSTATYRPGDRLGLLKAVTAIGVGVLQARTAFRRIDPDVVVGFGGYPSVPALLAAITTGRPSVIHEANAVMGRANRALAPHVTAIGRAFPTLQKATAKIVARSVVVGNPVRPEIQALANLAYAPPTGEINLLVTGGSQGARLLSDLVPKAIAQLPEALRVRLNVQQQARPESMDLARATYRIADVKADIAPFFRDMAGRLEAAHLVIGRSGASTVCELAVVGRPSILGPLQIALDDDQGQNARLLAEAGAAEVAREDVLSVDVMTKALETLLTNPDRLARMAAAARSVARPDAAERLADLVEATARR